MACGCWFGWGEAEHGCSDGCARGRDLSWLLTVVRRFGADLRSCCCRSWPAMPMAFTEFDFLVLPAAWLFSTRWFAEYFTAPRSGCRATLRLVRDRPGQRPASLVLVAGPGRAMASPGARSRLGRGGVPAVPGTPLIIPKRRDGDRPVLLVRRKSGWSPPTLGIVLGHTWSSAIPLVLGDPAGAVAAI